jgi:hypothetical protein
MAYTVPLDISGRTSNLKDCRKLASEITLKGAELFDLLGQELDLKVITYMHIFEIFFDLEKGSKG